MSSLHYNPPPSYAATVPTPNYSTVPLPCEELVELALNPPPYLTRTSSSSSSSSSSLGESSLQSSAASSSRPSTSQGARVEEPSKHFIFSSGNIELDLGPKDGDIPSYGLQGRVRGVVRIKKMNHVQGIVISLEGRAQVTAMQGGLPCGHTERKLLYVPLKLYTKESSAKAKARATPSSEFPFELAFPTHADSTDPTAAPIALPPTFRNSHPSMEGWIKYTVKIQVIKSGLWPRDVLATVVHYLPKFYSLPETLLWPAISLMDAKRFGLETNEKWKTTRASLSSKTPVQDEPTMSVSIPRTARAVANYCFPVNVTLRIPSSSIPRKARTQEGKPITSIDDLLADPTRVQITMIKTTTLTTPTVGAKSSQVTTLARAYRQQIEAELVSRPHDERIIRAWFRAGRKEGEASWEIPGLVDVRYAIRVTVSLGEGEGCIFKHDEEVRMFSHSLGQFECPFEVHDEPARNLLLASALGNNLTRF